MQAEDSDPTITSGSSQPRKWDWIFRALHSVSGRRQNSITMSIPDTVLFTGGQPTKWLTTLADGRVARQMMPNESTYTSRGGRSAREKAPKVNELLILEQIRVVHDKFLEFRSAFSDFESVETSPLCVAWYTDGKKELLQSHTLLMLMKHAEWRVQLTALQAYVKPKKTAIGNFHFSQITRIGNDDMSQSNAALDILTRSLAQYAEKAYAITSDDAQDTSDYQSISTPPPLPVSNLKVDAMKADFVFDENDKLWFSHVSSVHVHVVHAQLELAASLRRVEETKYLEAATAVSAELKRLLRMASNRGVPVSASFAHFDDQGVGYVDAGGLVEGLKRLGIGISPRAADILMSMIGTASSLHFRAQDLVIFAELDEEQEKRGDYADDADGDSFETARGKTTATSSRGGGPKTAALQQGRGQTSSMTASKGSDKKKDAWGTNDAAPDLPGIPLDLDYNAGKPGPKVSEEPLPPWARSKSKKAYKELKRAEGRYMDQQAKKSQFQGYDHDLSDDDEKKKTEEAAQTAAPAVMRDRDDDDHPFGTGFSNDADSVSIQSSQSSLVSLSNIPGLNVPAGEADIDVDLDDRDSLFHAQNSIVMSYRVLNAAVRPIASRKAGSTTLQQTQSVQKSREVLERLLPEKETPFQLVVTPDIFMTLDTLQEALETWLDHHTKSSILLVGLPGLPNTMWPKGVILNNATHAECLSSLLQHVQFGKEFVPNPNIPLFFLGFGNGAACLTYFASAQLHDEVHYQFKHSAKAMILCNSFAKVNQELKRTVQGIRRVFKSDDYNERVQLILSILFSGDYLEKTGREEAMEIFWKTRLKISLHDVEESKKLKRVSNLCSGNGKEGISALLHGMQSNVDCTGKFDMLEIPLLLVQSTQDNFIAPTSIEVFEQTDQEYRIVQSPRDLLTSNGRASNSRVIRVEWLKCGHEILQERKSALSDLFVRLVIGAHQTEEVELTDLDNLAGQTKIEEKAQDLHDFFDILEEEAGVKPHTQAERGHRAGFVGHAKENNADDTSIGGLSLGTEGTGGDSLDTDQNKDVESIQDKQDKKRERRAREAQVRKQREEERKMRKIQDERKAELKKIRQAEQSRAEENKALTERHSMHKEDMRSSLAEDYFRECEEWEIQAETAREKAAELQAAREEDELAELEAEAAKKRALKHEQRRERVIELRKKYLQDELTMDGDKEGVFTQGIHSLDASQAATFSSRLLADLFQCRKRMVDAMKRAKLALDKVKVFQSEYDATEREVRGLRRTQRLATTNSTFQAIKPTKRELEELEKKLDAYQNQASEIKSLLNGRLDVLNISNKSVQGLKTVLHGKEETIVQVLKLLRTVEDKMRSKLAVFRVTRDNYSTERDEIEKILAQSEDRMRVVTIELKKVKKHGGKYVDTDVWQKGVLQRMLTVDIKEHLEREQNTLGRVLVEFKKSLTDTKNGILKCDKDITALTKESDELKAVEAELSKGWAKAQSKSVAVEFEEQMRLEDNAATIDEGTEERKNKAKEAMKKKGSLADEVRLKNGEDRTKEMKMWVSMDVVINPDKYFHVSEVEAEEMKFDPDYSFKLSAQDIKRILNLPTQVQLALPFLYSPLEITAHQLLTKFSLEEGENYFRESDKKSQDVGDETVVAQVSPAQAAEAERQLNVLLKERRCADVRSFPIAELNQEQKDWIALDKILNPYIYQTLKEGGVEAAKASNANVHNVPLLGDKYDHLRKQYEEGKLDEWQCGFDDITLRELYKESIADLEDKDERYAKYLMDKFYVSDEETKVGERAKEALEGIIKVRENLAKKLPPYFGNDDPHANSGAASGVLGKLKGMKGAATATPGKDHPAAKLDKPGGTGKSPAKSELEGSDDDDFVPNNSKKVFGSWYVVHPASLGRDSQAVSFNPAEYDDLRDHPASFQKYTPLPSVKTENIQELDPVKVVLSHPKHPEWLRSTSNLECKVVNSLEELAQINNNHVKKGLKVLVTSKKSQEILNEVNHSLESRQSRAHKFTILSTGLDKILDMTVSVVFQGVFGPRGYRLGRLAVQLYRMPNELEKSEGKSVVPQAIGFAPYEMQVLNTPDALGRIVIHHRPLKVPVEPGTFQVVIGAAAASKYSIQVNGTLGEDAGTVVDREFKQGLEKQNRLTQCSFEATELWTSMRLAERKTAVCQGLQDEAESESARCETDIETCNNELARDDEDMMMTEQERNDVLREIKVLEVEFAHWCKLFATRSQEKKDIKEGLDQMAKLRRSRLKEKDELKAELETIRKHIPGAAAAIFGPAKATEIALALNAPLNMAANTSASNRWQAVAAVRDLISASLTPADEVRKLYQREGINALTLEERQWCMLDRSLNEEKWEWLKLKEEEEDAKRAEKGSRAKKRKFNPAIEQFRIDKNEVQRIQTTPFSKLQRREVAIKKLLMKFHDDSTQMRRKAEQLSSGFNPHLAADVRIKAPHTRSPTEIEWVTIDKILNPSSWKHEIESLKANESASMDSQKNNSMLKELDQNEMEEFEKKDPSKIAGLMGARRNSGLSITKVMAQAGKNKKDGGNVKPVGKWVCNFSRDEILVIWSAKTEEELKTNEEERCWKLLRSYNGSYHEYVEFQRLSEEKRKRLEETKGSDWIAIRFDQSGSSLEVDVDARCRTVLKELDKTISYKNPFMDSAVLHLAPQRFPTTVLRLELERELDRLLREQIYERERASKFLVDVDSDDEDEKAGDVVEENEEEREARADMRRKERRAAMRAGRAIQDVKNAKRRLMLDNKSASEIAQMKELEALGFGGCLACRSNPCHWESAMDVAELVKRKQQIADELNYIRKHPEMIVIDSTIALSAQRGGSTRFKREDLIHELMWEARELDRRLKLNGIDKELHDAYATRKEYMEVKVLHGYATLFWTTNARRALEWEHNKLVATQTAMDVVDDILEWMLEGWYFGERESQHSVAGFVPSVKKDGFVRPGIETMKASKLKVLREQRIKFGELKVENDENSEGTPWEKLVPIEAASQLRITKNKVIKLGDERDHILNETEQTMKFGLFSLTFMYFRAMKMVRREKLSWAGATEAIGAENDIKKKNITAERKKIMEEARNEAERARLMNAAMVKAKEGEMRKNLREEKERAEAARKLYERMRKEKMEKAASLVLERVYRGHLGRKAARRWARKKAELEAMNALMNAAAVTIQRCTRGHLGRMLASDVRLEMATFIAQIREEEAKQDEDEYWRTHAFARYKRDVKDFVKTVAEGIKKLQESRVSSVVKSEDQNFETNDEGP